ncbi:MAG: Lrp/AsnC family transcriptional regulator [Actinomycetota bacterium]
MPKIDRKNIEILGLLQQDARVSNRSLAESIDMSASSTLERTRELERSGVITGYHADVDLRALGRTVEALIMVRVAPKNRERVDAVIAEIWELPETIGLSLLSGEIDLIVHVAVAGTDQLRDVIVDRIASIQGVVDERTSLLFDHRRKPVVEPL